MGVLPILAGGSIGLLLLVNLYHVLSTLVGNSDLYLLPNLYHDIANGTFQWFYWCLAPARNISPDLITFALLKSFIHSDILALFVQIILYVLLSGLLIAYLAHKLSGVSYLKSLLPVFVAIAFLTLPGLFAQGAIYGLAVPTWHGGAVPLTLFSWIIWLSCVDSPTRLRLCGLAVVSLAVGFSDPLCFMTFIYPAALGILFPKYSWLSKFGLAMLVILPALLGNWLGDLVAPMSSIQYAHQGSIDIPSMLAACHRFFMDFAVWHVLLCWVTLLVGLVVALRYWKVTPTTVHKWVGLMLMLAMPVAGTLLLGRYGDSGHFRYCPLTFLLPLVALIWVVWRKYERPLSAAVAIIATTIVCASAQYLPPWAEMTRLRDAELIESYVGDLKLKSGLANYFLSCLIRYHSHGRLMVNDLHPSGLLNMKLCSLAWLGVSYIPPKRDYNFIITKGLDTSMLLRLYGPPSAVYGILLEDQGTQIWIYDRNLSDAIAMQPPLIGLLIERQNRSGYLLKPQERTALAQRLAYYINSLNRSRSVLPAH